ncbi:hypothetical protein GCM10020367_22500 [Streptomyces sannanensis]|uniref:Uncharacterized protein n=1 Tax=Streptomyces sannanensis TaxID=285536 RepID=A0ABP6SA14_9ACTN
MQVLFLALGASRKRAVIEESAEVVAAGGRAVVLIQRKKSWKSVEFAPGVDVLTSDELDAAHMPRRIEHLVLYRIPRFVISMFGIGPVRRLTRRVHKAYKRRVASRIHNKLFMPVHRRLWPALSARMMRSHFAQAPGGGPDLMVVTDSLSVRLAMHLLDTWERDGLALPRVSYSIDYDERAEPVPASAAR